MKGIRQNQTLYRETFIVCLLWIRGPMKMSYKRTDQVTFVSANFDFFATPLLVPIRLPWPVVVSRAAVLVFLNAAVLVEVLAVQQMRSFEDAESAVVRAIRREVGDALVYFEFTNFTWSLVNVFPGLVSVMKIWGRRISRKNTNVAKPL